MKFDQIPGQKASFTVLQIRQSDHLAGGISTTNPTQPSLPLFFFFLPRQTFKPRKPLAPEDKHSRPSAWYISRLSCFSLSVRGQQTPHLLSLQIPANLMKKADLLSIWCGISVWYAIAYIISNSSGKKTLSTNAVCDIYLNSNVNNKCWSTSQWSGWLLNIRRWLTNSMHINCTCFEVISKSGFGLILYYLLVLLFNELPTNYIYFGQHSNKCICLQRQLAVILDCSTMKLLELSNASCHKVSSMA